MNEGSNGQGETGDLPFGLGRYGLLVYLAGATGFILGGYGPARKAAIQFYAEHQHCPPMSRPEAVMYYRKRNYRIAWSYLQGGLSRGLQVATVGLFYTVADCAWHRMAPAGTGPIAWLREPVCGALTGTLFAMAGKGHRLYYALQGGKLGLALGGLLGTSRLLHSRMTESRAE